MEDIVTMTFDRTLLNPSDIRSPQDSVCTSRNTSPVPDVLQYSDISDDEGVPPPPSAPHPDVIQQLVKISDRPEFTFAKPKATVPSALIALVERVCRRKVPEVMTKLQEEATRVEDSESFKKMATEHRNLLTELIRAVRVLSVRYLKNLAMPKSQLDSIKFSLYKRVAVWRDQVDSVIHIAERQSGWSEARRQMLWRRMVSASRWRMIGLQLRETYDEEDIVEAKRG